MVRKIVKEMDTLKGYIRAMLHGRVPFDPPVTFPQSHILYADSIRHAHEIIKKGGYFVVSKDDIQYFKASRSQSEVNFQFATKSKTAAFSERGGGGGEKLDSKTFFAKDYWKLQIMLGEDGRTSDWILMKGARQCKDVAFPGDIVVDKMALAGPVMTNSLPEVNDNYEEEKPTEGWRKEKKKMRKALKNSPAYIRGRIDTPPKKKSVDPPSPQTTEEEEVTTEKVEKTKKKDLEKVKKPKKKYFEFVKRVLELKSKKKAEKKNFQEQDVLAAPNFTPKVEQHLISSSSSLYFGLS